MVFKRFKGFKRLRAGKRQAWTPINIDVSLGVPVGCRMKHAKRMFKRCGLGAALLPARFGVPRSFCTVCRVLRVLRRVLRVLRVLKRFKGFKHLRGGKRQAWTPIRSH